MGLLDLAMTTLSFVFLGLLLVEFTVSLSDERARQLNLATLVIWAIFAVDFFVRLALAESKLRYLRENWLAGLAVMVPAFRVLRTVQAVRAARSVQLVRMFTGTNRGVRALHHVLAKGAPLYVLLLTLIMLAISAAGMYSLERGVAGANITSMGDALWWSASTLTTVGSEAYPVTPEGRMLAVLLMLYGLGLAGYITAALAALLLGNLNPPSAPPEIAQSVAALHEEIRELRRQLAADGEQGPPAPPPATQGRSVSARPTPAQPFAPAGAGAELGEQPPPPAAPPV